MNDNAKKIECHVCKYIHRWPSCSVGTSRSSKISLTLPTWLLTDIKDEVGYGNVSNYVVNALISYRDTGI